jgi:hypothetical protein
MDAQSTDSDLQTTGEGWLGWLARERASGRFYRWATVGTAILLAAVLIALVPILVRAGEPGSCFRRRSSQCRWSRSCFPRSP